MLKNINWRQGLIYSLLGLYIVGLAGLSPVQAAETRTWDFIVCDGEKGDNVCDFNDLKNLVNVVINFAIFGLAMPIAVIGIMYAGGLYVWNAGNPDGRSKATDIFTNILIGLVLMLAAYLIVKMLVLGLVGNTSNPVSQALKDFFQ